MHHDKEVTQVEHEGAQDLSNGELEQSQNDKGLSKAACEVAHDEEGCCSG